MRMIEGSGAWWRIRGTLAAASPIGTGVWSACGWVTTRLTTEGILGGHGWFGRAGVWTVRFGARGVRGCGMMAMLLDVCGTPMTSMRMMGVCRRGRGCWTTDRTMRVVSG